MIIEAIIGIVLLNVLFYWRTLGYKYVSDDLISSYRQPEKNWFLQQFWALEGKLKSMSFKKIAEINTSNQGIKAANTIIQEANAKKTDPKTHAPLQQYIPLSNAALPKVDHAITVTLHALVAVGIFLGFGSNPISFLAAVLFSLCPMNNQGAMWISCRGYVLAALGMVWAMALPLWVGGIALFIATYSNAGFLMPLVLLGTTHWPLIICAGFLWWYWAPTFKKNVIAKMNMEVYTHDKQIHPKKLILGLRTFGFYLSRSIIPRPQTFYHKELESIAGSKAGTAYRLDTLFWTGFLGFAAMVAYVCLTPWNMISLGLLWFCLGIAPFCNLYRMQQESADRYAYVPNVGLMFVLAAVLIHWPIVLGIWLGAYALTTWQFMPAYKDDFWLIEHSRTNEPNSWFAWHIAAMTRFNVGSYQEAMMFWVMANVVSPKEFKILINIAIMLKMMHREKESQDFLQKAMDNIPKGQEVTANKMIQDVRDGKIAIVV